MKPKIYYVGTFIDLARIFDPDVDDEQDGDSQD